MFEIQNVDDYGELERFIRNDRWHVKIKSSGPIQVIPLANWVWLNHNRSFKFIPEGYLIHHLDLDPLNDDPSNLAIMLKSLHTSYHLKHLSREVNVVIDRESGTPIYKPNAHYISTKKVWRIDYVVRMASGKTEQRRLYNHGEYGTPFKTQEQATQFIKYKWPYAQWP